MKTKSFKLMLIIAMVIVGAIFNSYAQSKPNNQVSKGVNLLKNKKHYLNFQTTGDLYNYTFEASDGPLFLFPTLHQYVSRIFNILHHLSGGFVLHSSTIVIDGLAYIFTGKSGVGKSTIVSLIKEFYPSGDIISDNSAFIKKQNGKYIIYPSPYMEANRLQTLQYKFNKKPPYKIAALFFPSHSRVNKFTEMNFEEKINNIKNNSHISYKPEKLFDKIQKEKFAKMIFEFVSFTKIQKVQFAPTGKFVYYFLEYACGKKV